MWKNTNGKLIHTTDLTRKKYKTRLDLEIVQQLKNLAIETNSNVAYLLENGFQNMLQQQMHPKLENKKKSTRIQLMATCEEQIWAAMQTFAKEQQVYMNTCIEYSVQFINREAVKKDAHRYRIE